MTLSAWRADGRGSGIEMRHGVGGTALRPPGRHRVEAGS